MLSRAQMFMSRGLPLAAALGTLAFVQHKVERRKSQGQASTPNNTVKTEEEILQNKERLLMEAQMAAVSKELRSKNPLRYLPQATSPVRDTSPEAGCSQEAAAVEREMASTLDDPDGQIGEWIIHTMVLANDNGDGLLLENAIWDDKEEKMLFHDC